MALYGRSLTAMGEPVEVHWHEHAVSRAEREATVGHRGCVVWFTGLSGSGKSTLANLVDHRLHAAGLRSFVLDGDNVRMGLNASPAMLEPRYGRDYAARFGLSFAAEDRTENIRRIGAVAGLFTQAGLITLTAFVSPFRADRDAVRAALDSEDFVEVYVQAPLEVCEARDPKGLYKKARSGEIRDFTGIHQPYESPLSPELTLDTSTSTPDALAGEVLAYLAGTGRIPATVC
jgi:adenylylsulfate kinase